MRQFSPRAAGQGSLAYLERQIVRPSHSCKVFVAGQESETGLEAFFQKQMASMSA